MPTDLDNSPSESDAEEGSAAAQIIAPQKFRQVEELAIRPSDLKTYYSNQAGFMTTQYDITLSFAKVGPDPLGKPTSEHQCNVAMSYEHAKALAVMLLSATREREKDFGPIFILRKDQKATSSDAPKENNPEEKKGRAISLEDE